jgi:acetolactate synthase-1/2/3 large subunit
VLFDNGAYGNVLRDQHRLYEGREVAARLANPDFVAVAESFGVTAHRAHTPDELAGALEVAFAQDQPALVHVPVDPREERSPWPLLIPASRRGPST